MEKGEGDGECKNGMRKGKGKEEGQEEGTRWDAVGNVEMRMDPCVRNNWDSSGAGIKTTPQADVGVANTQGGGLEKFNVWHVTTHFDNPICVLGVCRKLRTSSFGGMVSTKRRLLSQGVVGHCRERSLHWLSKRQAGV